MSCRRWLPVSIAAVLLLLGGRPATAGEIKIVLTGFSLNYDSTSFLVYDSNDPAGGGGDPAQSTPLASASFYQDGLLLGTQTTNVFSDFFISVLAPIPLTGGKIAADAGVFDLLTKGVAPGWGLALDASSWQLDYDPLSHVFSGFTTDVMLCPTCIPNQDLPFGLIIDGAQPITVSFLTTITQSTDDGTNFLTFAADGSSTITGAAIPEPSSLGLLTIGLVGIVCTSRARRSLPGA